MEGSRPLEIWLKSNCAVVLTNFPVLSISTSPSAEPDLVWQRLCRFWRAMTAGVLDRAASD
jgi:hypothetical protein